MVESNNLSLAEHDAIAGAAIMSNIIGTRRSGRVSTLLAKATSFINPDPGWVIGTTEGPPVTNLATNSGDGTDRSAEYYTRLAVTYTDPFSTDPTVGDILYGDQTGFVAIVNDFNSGSMYLDIFLMPVQRVTYPAGAWSAGDPLVGETITVTATNRDAGVKTAVGIVVAHDTANNRIDIGLTNGVSFADGDVMSNGASTHTISIAATDAILAPITRFPGQKLTCGGGETTAWGLGDIVVGTDVFGTTTGIVTFYHNASNYISVVPTSGTEFRVGMTLVNSTTGATMPALISADWDRLTHAAGFTALAKECVIEELTLGSLRIPNDPAKPTIKAGEMGMHWPIMSIGACMQDKQCQELGWGAAETGAWNIGDQITGTDVDGSVYALIRDVDLGGNVIHTAPLPGTLQLQAFRLGMTVHNDTTGGDIGAPGLNVVEWKTPSHNTGYWPSVFEGTGVNEWRRGFPMRRGMVGRRGGGICIRGVGVCYSDVPAGEANYLDIIIVNDWRYPETGSLTSTNEAGGLRFMPDGRKLGWRIEIPDTGAGQGNLFSFEIFCRGIHPQTQAWWGRFSMGAALYTESADSSSILVDEALVPIYRSFVIGSPQLRPEEHDYNVSICMAVEGTAGAGAKPAQAWGTVGCSTIKQDGTRIYVKVYECEAEYQPGS